MSDDYQFILQISHCISIIGIRNEKEELIVFFIDWLWRHFNMYVTVNVIKLVIMHISRLFLAYF